MRIHAPIGQMLTDGERVRCHLCGRWFLSVASHIRVHGWSKADYIAEFGLELGNPLSGPVTRERRAAALLARKVEPAIRHAQQRALTRSRSGALAAAAAQAARGRRHPTERRSKTLAALAGIDPQARAEGNRRRGRRHRERLTQQVAARFGFATFDAYLADRFDAGMSMAAISREAGLHKDWVSRHVSAAGLSPDTSGSGGADRLAPAARRLGFAGTLAYLTTTHLEQHRSVASIAAEAGVTRSTVLTALRRHGIDPVPHATKRHHADTRGRTVAEALGFATLRAYITDRRDAGMPWTALAAETGLPATTLRRHLAVTGSTY
jgi:lambda repressor-like predicted transcriptional regulator